jgi:inward rectifier potassium channel
LLLHEEFSKSIIMHIKKNNFDPGFGYRSTTFGRLLREDGSFNVERKGIRYFDAYMKLISMPWWQFFLFLFGGYIVINAIFGLLFVFAGIEQLSGLDSQGFFPDFIHAFYFSVQTFTTVGYGAVNPGIGNANLIATIDAFVGLMSFALATGLFFARFSRPGKSILFSDSSVIAPFQGKTAFMFRIANLHNDKILDLEANVLVSYIQKEGNQTMRRYERLKLQINRIAMFPLSWTIVHPIEEDSFFYGKTESELIDMHMEVITMVKGYDETYAQFINASRSYTCRELKWGFRFDLMYQNEETGIVLKLDEISTVREAI